ncbi:MAG: hypothetical protein P1U74_00215 [Legionellaceae bacterium]|nr:hypothetical protein [Legionellaceae bacterium]
MSDSSNETTPSAEGGSSSPSSSEGSSSTAPSSNEGSSSTAQTTSPVPEAPAPSGGTAGKDKEADEKKSSSAVNRIAASIKEQQKKKREEEKKPPPGGNADVQALYEGMENFKKFGNTMRDNLPGAMENIGKLFKQWAKENDIDWFSSDKVDPKDNPYGGHAARERMLAEQEIARDEQAGSEEESVGKVSKEDTSSNKEERGFEMTTFRSSSPTSVDKLHSKIDEDKRASSDKDGDKGGPGIDSDSSEEIDSPDVTGPT